MSTYWSESSANFQVEGSAQCPAHANALKRADLAAGVTNNRGNCVSDVRTATDFPQAPGPVEVGTGPPGCPGPSLTRCVLVQPSVVLMSVPWYEASAER